MSESESESESERDREVDSNMHEANKTYSIKVYITHSNVHKLYINIISGK